MEKRHRGRKKCALDAEFFSSGRTYVGRIDNVLEEEMDCLMTSFIDAPPGFTPDKTISLKISLPEGEPISLSCETIWFLRVSREDKTLIGMRIIDPPNEYMKFIREHVAA